MNQHEYVAPHGTLKRRHVVAAALGVAGGAVLWSAPGTAAVAADASPAGPWNGRRSANGWPVIDETPEHRIEGAGNTGVSCLGGDVATVLLHLARRYHYEVRAITPRDITGHTTERVLGRRYESNYLSGTAITIFPALYPAGAKGNVYPQDLATIRDILAELEGLVKWGGDFDPAKESHFQIDVAPRDPKLTDVAARIRGWESRPGAGAGVVPDVFATRRRVRARDLRNRQNR
ncbi:hypothetical protein [Streptomyces pactum]|uniref:Peptidase M15C domain-containing protein n=1 Tax=Streptomyces pactum TaxID=68249 RepID=A0A1S6J539_9ACTN|nr:hypothetical protein [Streptomyces pactum]AQS66889.1 hypothetical protein B1H29_08100 [Streptomyces pactum]